MKTEPPQIVLLLLLLWLWLLVVVDGWWLVVGGWWLVVGGCWLVVVVVGCCWCWCFRRLLNSMCMVTTVMTMHQSLRLIYMWQCTEDKMQMKSISETKRKLEQSKVDLGENSAQEDYVTPKRQPKRFMTRAMSN